MIVVIINSILAYVITKLNVKEKAITDTEAQISEGLKLTVAFFLNSVLTPLISKKIYFYTEGDAVMLIGIFPLLPRLILDELVYKCMTTWFCIAILTPLTEILSVSNILVWIRRAIISCQGERCNLTQYDANKAFEPAVFWLPRKFAYSLLMIFYTAFYLPLFPAGIIISIIAIVTHFYCNRFLLVMICGKPPKMGTELPRVFMQLGEFAVLIFCV